MGRPAKPNQSKICVYLDRMVHARLERYLADEKIKRLENSEEIKSCTISSVVETALDKFLAAQENKQK